MHIYNKIKVCSNYCATTPHILKIYSELYVTSLQQIILRRKCKSLLVFSVVKFTVITFLNCFSLFAYKPAMFSLFVSTGMLNAIL